MRVLAATGPPWQEGVVQTAVAFVVVALAWIVLDRLGRRLIDRLVSRETARNNVSGDERAQRIRTLWSVGRIFITIILLVVFLLLALAVWGIPTTPFLAVGSVIGIAVGFGAQDLVRDVIAGLFIVSEDQYGIDDVVRIAGVAGRVESIRLRTTVLRDLDGNVHHIPNGQITVATNLTQEFAQVVIDLSVSYEADIDRALDVALDEAQRFYEDPEWSQDFLEAPEMLGVQAFAESAITLRLTFKVRPAQRWTYRREYLKRIKRRFDAEGILIPYPHMTLVSGDRPLREQGSAPSDPPEPE